eukprot:maker-scaffold_7-snap-gene-4.10-mRNA-1 protein AED:0.01 eAED:0.01 QI:163/1/1/1/0.8/0.83/6/67/550
MRRKRSSRVPEKNSFNQVDYEKLFSSLGGDNNRLAKPLETESHTLVALGSMKQIEENNLQFFVKDVHFPVGYESLIKFPSLDDPKTQETYRNVIALETQPGKAQIPIFQIFNYKNEKIAEAKTALEAWKFVVGKIPSTKIKKNIRNLIVNRWGKENFGLKDEVISSILKKFHDSRLEMPLPVKDLPKKSSFSRKRKIRDTPKLENDMKRQKTELNLTGRETRGTSKNFGTKPATSSAEIFKTDIKPSVQNKESPVKKKLGRPRRKRSPRPVKGIAKVEEEAKKDAPVEPSQHNKTSVKASKFRKGDQIEARFGDEKGWFPGVVKRARLANGAFVYDIKFDDGDFSKGEKEYRIRFPEDVIEIEPGESEEDVESVKQQDELNINDRVLAKYFDGNWYRGIVKEKSKNIHNVFVYDVLYDDGDEEQEKYIQDLKRLKNKPLPSSQLLPEREILELREIALEENIIQKDSKTDIDLALLLSITSLIASQCLALRRLGKKTGVIRLDGPPEDTVAIKTNLHDGIRNEALQRAQILLSPYSFTLSEDKASILVNF